MTVYCAECNKPFNMTIRIEWPYFCCGQCAVQWECRKGALNTVA